MSIIFLATKMIACIMVIIRKKGVDVMARRRDYGGDRVTKYEFLEFQKAVGRIVDEDVNIAYDRFETKAKRLERIVNRSEDKTEDKIAKVLEASEARLAADIAASEARLAADREEFMRRFAAERKEWQSTKRWLYLNFEG